MEPHDLAIPKGGDTHEVPQDDNNEAELRVQSGHDEDGHSLSDSQDGGGQHIESVSAADTGGDGVLRSVWKKLPEHQIHHSEGVRLADAPSEAGNGNKFAVEDDGSESENYSQIDSNMIREATESAIKDAIAMKRSDSFLSTDSNDLSHHDDLSMGGGSFPSPLPTNKRTHSASISYMENASFEARILSSGTDTVIQQHGNVVGREDFGSSSSSRRVSSVLRNSSISVGSGGTQRESWNFDDLLAEEGGSSPSQRSERYVFGQVTKRISDSSAPFLETIVSEDSQEDHVVRDEPESPVDGSLVELLKSCHIEMSEIPPGSESRPREVYLLHLIFKDFCRPSLSLEAVESIYQNEINGTTTKNPVPLPLDVVIERPNPSLVKLLGTPLIRLPREWAMSMFRILLRILTNESDADYDASTLKTCTWYEETFGEGVMASDEMKSGQRTESTSSVKNQRPFTEKSSGGNGAETAKSNRMYTVVRLLGSWKSVVDHLLGAMDEILSCSEHLMGPATRLLGVLCSGGITVKQLRCIMDLATRPDATAMTQLLMIRALRFAAAGSSRSLLSKADPRSFFSFKFGTGLTRTINLEKSGWPFKNDFGMAVWFRAECFKESSTLLRIANSVGDGVKVSLEPLDETGSGSAAASMLTISVLEDGDAIQCIKVRQGILHERVWYHVAVRHTRSRLKGVFSMGSREQLVVLLDGKTMVTDSVKFPVVRDSKSMIVGFGEKFDGQTGAVYVFNNNVSDATLRALYEKSASTFNSSFPRRLSGEWNSLQGDIARQTKALDLEMRHDDIEDIVFSYHSDKETNRNQAHVFDVDEDDSGQETGPLSRGAFGSRLYIAWDPARIAGQVVLELHSGAHVRMDSDCVQVWKVDNLQDILGSVGGVQAFLPIFHVLLAPTVLGQQACIPLEKRDHILRKCLLCWAVPDVVLLLSSFVQDHGENAREMMRCGAIDMLEQILLANKYSTIPYSYDEGVVFSMFSALSIFPSLSRLLVDAVLELRTICLRYTGLETKVFTKLIFNVPLWFGESLVGVSMYLNLVPVLSSISKQFPQKVRDSVGVSGIVKVIVDLVEAETPGTSTLSSCNDNFDRCLHDFRSLCSPLSTNERWHACEVLFGFLFQVFFVGSAVDEVGLLVGYLSKVCDSEWETASKEVSCGQQISRSGHRELRHRFALRTSSLIHLLLQSPTAPSDFLSNLVRACGGVQACAAWMLSSLVNSYCDRIRGLGIRCFVAYLRATGSHPDAPLALDDPSSIEIIGRSSEGKTLQENTLTLISHVGHGLMNSNVGKGLASIGPVMRSNSHAAPKLTPRVAYKLLWHLLKSHRYRIEVWTQASLVGIVFEQKSLTSAIVDPSLRDNLYTPDSVFHNTTTLNWVWVSKLMQDNTVSIESPITGELGMNTIVRLLRFLPGDCLENWLVDLAKQAARTQSVVDMLSSTVDWQPCLFQLASELLESAVCATTKVMDRADPQIEVRQAKSFDAEATSRRLDLALDLYAILLANLFRRGGEKALISIEDCSSLQRVCVNGQQVLIFILSKLFENLAESGVLPLEKVAVHAALHCLEQHRVLLKRSARLITDTILSNSSKGMTMPEAVDCWRSLRHLTAVSVAMISRLGFGTTIVSAIDPISDSSFGISLTDDEVKAAGARTVMALICEDASCCDEIHQQTTEAAKLGLEKAIDRLVCVNLAAQVLALLDVFIFPDSLDATLPVSQLHGLALVRNTEARIGGGQGPLLASLVRLSLVLLNQLEPCSVSLLQCSSRLRCFLHWIFEMIRESEALDGYSATFNKLTAPFDRLVLLVVVQCRQVLRRANAQKSDLEVQSTDIDLNGRERRKKSYRRLLRVCLEMREILVTVLDQRVDLLRGSLSESSFDALTLALDGNENIEGSKEVLVQQLLSSDWVVGFEGMTSHGNVTVPNVFRNDETSRGIFEFRELQREAKDMSVYFEKSLNVCFERYLEGQRKWAETGAVRDLEYEGDSTLKRLSSASVTALDDFSKIVELRKEAADSRWHSIDHKVGRIWTPHDHWRLPCGADALGKRIVLVPNEKFEDHAEASYELLQGREREKEQRERHERLTRKEELSELMKRNSQAFVPTVDNIAVDDDEDRDIEAKCAFEDEEMTDRQEGVPSATVDDVETGLVAELDSKADSKEPDIEDTDGWARAFVWSDNESVVARFDNVVMVNLQYLVDGKLLLTTHGLYFHQIGDKKNSVTKEIFTRDQATSTAGRDRRWRLSRLTEVHGRRYLLRPQALELFFSDWNELFINFANGQKDRNRFFAKLRNSCRVPMLFSPKTLNPRTIFKRSNIAELWRKRRISNFDYIVSLNRMAGRTFNDIAQYPVFPWILADYSSEKIDLSDSRMYRDFSKPVGALNPDRLSQLIERYNELEQFGFAENERFLYGSHYSSPGVILHFLIRQEPFTSMAIDLQSGRFDCPDRLFFDLAESWRSCNTSSSDVKELIPEFFTLPEMFLNTNNYPLGKTQRGQQIDNVVLPPWAKGSAHEFVRLHRLALESDHVSRNLHHWIDLVFGCKQRGPEAEAAHNVFHHLSYEGAVDLDKITDEIDRQATESHIQNFGQTPSQILPKESHPCRLSSEECWYPLINNLSSTVRLRCHTPGKQYGGRKGVCGSAIKIGIQADLITVIYSDWKVGTFRWYPKVPKNRLKPDKLRPLPNRFGCYSRAVVKRGSAAPQLMDDDVNELSVGNWSVAVTVGGYEKEQNRRKALMPSRLASAKDALYTDSASLIISCGYWDNSIKVHSTDAWKLECREAGGHYGRIRCLSVADDGGFMVTGGQDSTCRVWVIDNPDLAVSLADGYIQTALGHSTDGEHILCCCHVLWGHEGPVSCVHLSSDLDVVVSGSLDGRICVHTLRRGEFIRSFKPATKPTSSPVPINKVALDKHGRLVIYMGDGALQTYTLNGCRLCHVDAQEIIHDMTITGEVLITGGDRCHVYIRDLTTLKILSGLDLSRHGPVRSISLTPDDLNPTPQHLFIGSDDGMISIVDREEIRASTGGR